MCSGCISDGSASYTAFINRNGLRRGSAQLPVPADTHQRGKHTRLPRLTESFPFVPFCSLTLRYVPFTFLSSAFI